MPAAYFTTNTELNDGWAATYDTDGNVLPLVDDLVFDERVVPLLRHQPPRGEDSMLGAGRVEGLDVPPGDDGIEGVAVGSGDGAGTKASTAKLRILEIGCGTGRNTVKLLGKESHLPPGSIVYAIDISEKMMAEAIRKVDALGISVTVNGQGGANDGIVGGARIEFALSDVHTQLAEVEAFVGGKAAVDVVISTLVIDHVPLDSFFGAVAGMLKPRGWAWISYMHPDIASLTQAGYRPRKGGQSTGDGENDCPSVFGSSYAHEISDVVGTAKKFGLEVVGDIEERGVGVMCVSL